MVIELPNVKSSAQIRKELADEGKPVMLAFSGGKDSVAAWIALREAGVEVKPYFFYFVPGIKFIDEQMDYYSEFFGTYIPRFPSASIYRWFNHMTFQSPDRLHTILAADLIEMSVDQTVELIRDDYYQLPPETWIGNGTRACDSIVRRLAVQKHGPMRWASRKFQPVWDWQKADIMETVKKSGVKLPPDYEWFGRTFDGLDVRFMGPLKEHAPEDYETVLFWFPMLELELMRHDL